MLLKLLDKTVIILIHNFRMSCGRQASGKGLLTEISPCQPNCFEGSTSLCAGLQPEQKPFVLSPFGPKVKAAEETNTAWRHRGPHCHSVAQIRFHELVVLFSFE